MVDYTMKIRFDPGRITRLDNELEKPSPIFFGYDIEDRFIDRLEESTREAPVDRLFFMTDRFIFDRLGGRLFRRLKSDHPEIKPCFLPEGEKSKTFGVLQELCDGLVRKGATKGSLLIGFGGGSIGNVTGLAAGLIFRGIRFVEVPTTLSHQTDGTLSNKQAINSTFGKNHFGTYYPPLFTWTDTRYLDSEPKVFKKSGIVEGIKNGLIDQVHFIPFLKKHLKADCDYSPEEITDLCYKLIVSKIEILKKDPTEKGYGIVLEYGHTLGHAVEWLSRGRLTHGEGVAIGMKFSAELASRMGYIDREAAELHYTLIDAKLALKPGLPEGIDAASILDTMCVDNKKSGAGVKFVLLERIGRCKSADGGYLVPVKEKLVAETVERFVDHYRSTCRQPREVPLQRPVPSSDCRVGGAGFRT